MKPLLTRAGAGAVLLFACLPAGAEVRVISPDQGVLVERYIREERTLPAPAQIEQNTVLRPGSLVPDAIPLQPFHGVSGLANLGFFVSVDSKIVVVDPSTRTVVRIFDAPR